MAVIKYDGKKLIPAPILSINRSFNTAGDGSIIGTVYQINVNGKFLPHKGSPNSSGVFYTSTGYPADEIVGTDSAKFDSILKKQEGLRNLFSANNIGKKFEILNEDTGNTIFFYPVDVQIDIPEGVWVQECPYSITMTADSIYPNEIAPSGNIESASESWSIEPDQENLNNTFNFKVSHNISAKGRRFYNGSGVIDPWVSAKIWVDSRDGIDTSIISSGVYNLNGLSGYNHLVTTNIDELEGSYSLSESWIFASGIAYEDFSLESNTGLDGITNVGINGTITGFEHRNLQTVYTSRWQNASGYFLSVKNSLLNRAQAYTGTTLNPVPVSETIGRNPVAGTISYGYEYNTRPTTFISGAKSESISVTYNNKSKSHARVPVIGRNRGPVLQNLGTSEATTKNLSIEFVLGPQFNPANISGSFAFPYNLISGLVNILDPINLGASKSFYSQPQETWEPMTGRGSFNIEWTYE